MLMINYTCCRFYHLNPSDILVSDLINLNLKLITFNPFLLQKIRARETVTFNRSILPENWPFSLSNICKNSFFLTTNKHLVANQKKKKSLWAKILHLTSGRKNRFRNPTMRKNCDYSYSNALFK